MRSFCLLMCVIAAAVLGGCGGADAPPPRDPAQAGKVFAFDPIPDILGCLGARGIRAKRTGPYEVRVEPFSDGMRIRFAPTPADADVTQLRGGAEGAEVVRRILFYVGTAPDERIERVEKCVDDIGDKYS